MVSISFLNSCSSERAPSSSVETDKIILRAGHPANATEPYHLGLVEMARIANEMSDGRVEIQIYPAMQLGSEKAMIEGLLLGTIDIVVTANGSATNFVPQLGILDLPFLFRDREHMYSVMDGEVGEKLKISMEERGFHLLGFYDAGVRHIMTSNTPINSYEDLQGLKIRTMPVPAHIASFNAFGASAVAVDYGELYGGLQTGLVDGAEAANTNYDLKKFYEVAPNWAQIGWIILAADAIMSEEKFHSLPEDIQEILTEAGRRSAILERQAYADSDNSLLSVLQDKGVQVTFPDPAPFREASQTVYDEFVRTEEERDLLNAILNE
ncbi:MAG: TRAP transporter substrate-binding protein [Alphaproteobacteria bacterium]|nr:TRAP transporter substrate-binding protein [Alphaproteobacteria bacterium]